MISLINYEEFGSNMGFKSMRDFFETEGGLLICMEGY